MPIIDGALIAAVKSTIDSEFGAIPAGLNDTLIEEYRMKLAVCIARAAQYVRDNAVVNSNVIVTNVTGVMSGGSTSGPGTGNATGTIS